MKIFSAQKEAQWTTFIDILQTLWSLILRERDLAGRSQTSFLVDSLIGTTQECQKRPEKGGGKELPEEGLG